MLAKVCAAAANGIEAYPAEAEVNAGYGDTVIVIVGLPDAAVKESRDRVMTALINAGFSFTFGGATINLARADVKKDGPSFTPGPHRHDSSLSPLTRWNSRTLLVTSVSPSATACPAMSKS